MKWFLLVFFVFLGKTQFVKKAPEFFCAFTCTLGEKNSTDSSTFDCPTPHPIPRVDKYGLAITEITKSFTIQTEFNASAIPVSSVNTTSFNLRLLIESNDLIYFTFTIIAIGYQAENTWVDLFTHTLIAGITNPLDPWVSTANNQNTNYAISSKTMFSSTASLNYAEFIGCYSINTPPSGYPTVLQFQASTLSSVYVQVRIEVQKYVALTYFQGTILVFNPVTMSTDGAVFIHDMQTIKTVQPLDLALKYPNWGPRFNTKCIIGYNYFYFLHIQNLQMKFNFSLKQNFISLNNLGTSSLNTQFKSVTFCLSSDDLECDENTPFYDSIDKKCSIAALCPITTLDPGLLPTKPQLCILCSSTECVDCQSLNRSYCILCNITTHTTAVNGSCLCIAGYYRLGASCEANCSYFMEGCKLTNCTSLTTCNECSPKYYLKTTALRADCGLCSDVLSNCAQCSSSTDCTKCQASFYYNSPNSMCTPCYTAIPNCNTCTVNVPGPTCDSCEFGYINSVTTCECDEVNLTACAKCTTPTQCKNCTNASYFLDPVSFHCELCTTLYQCLSCSGYNNCTSCTNQSFALYLNTTDNSKLCKSCGVIMPNCVQCSSSTVCLSCEVGYGLNNLSQCQACSVLHPNCAECTNYTICDKCNDNNSTFFINSTCKTCAYVDSSCSSCILNGNVIVCLDCIPGYVLDAVAQVCSLCSTEIDDCVECKENSLSKQIECTLCSSLFLVDQNSTCQKCKKDKYVTRTCSNVTGCSSSHLINGKTVCLSCDASKHFQFDKTSQKCLCQNGFSLNQLSMKCEQICGDGILISMECDDGNTISGDGCSDQCMEEQNFQCTSNSSGASSCVLNQDISVVFDYMLKEMGQNKVSLYFTVTPPSTALSKVDWQKTITFNFSEPINAQFSYENGILIMTLEYSSDIDDKLMDLQLKFDPSIIKSASQKMSLKMQAANGPLNHENSSSLSNYKVSSTSGFALGMVCLLFYLISSYFHKMIGLETIQFIQLIYFVRIISPSTPVSSFYGFNTLKYSNGYNDIWSSSTNTGTDFKSINSAFIKLNLKLHFLQNCNLMLIPVALACLGYIYFSIQKSRSRAFFLETKEKVYKDELLIISRKVDWIYDNLIFSFTLSLLYLTVFSMLLYELSSLNQDQKPFFSLSFGVSLIVLFFVAAIYCYEIISGISKYFEMQDSKDNVRSDSKSLEYDANGVNHGCHPLYVSVYLAYQMLVIVTLSLIFISFSFLIETILGVTLLYLILICVWTPYQLKIHNIAIILNQSTVVLFILLQLLSKYKILQPTIYGLLLYVVMAMITIALILQLVRLYIHHKSDNEAFNLKDGQNLQQNANPTDKAIKPKLNSFSLEDQMKKNEPRLNLFPYEETLEKMSRLNSFTNEKSKKLNQRLPELKRVPLKSQENPHLIEHGELVKDQCDSLEQTKKRLREEFNFYFKEQNNQNRHPFL